jgi:hypothetical protein
MDNLARKLDASEALQQTGTVVRAAGEGYGVRTASGDHVAKRAASCLVEPALGDYVLVATLATGACYLLAVLERSDGARTQLVVDGDLSLKLPSGRFEVAAQEGVSLISPQDVSVVSGTLRINAVEGNVVVQRLSYLGRQLRSEVEKIKLVATSLDSVLERWSQKVQRAYRTVTEFDQVRAQRIDYRAEKAMNLHAQNAVVTAEELVKIDGDQIHLG